MHNTNNTILTVSPGLQTDDLNYISIKHNISSHLQLLLLLLAKSSIHQE